MIWIWIAFVAFVLLMLALDLGVFHRKAHVATLNRPRLVGRVVRHGIGVCRVRVLRLRWPVVWPRHRWGRGRWTYGRWCNGHGEVPDRLRRRELLEARAIFFVIATIFSFFAAPPLYKHRVLFWVSSALSLARLGDWSRGEVIRGVPLDSVPLCRLSHPDGDQDAFLKTDAHRSKQERRGPFDAPLFPVTARFHGEHFTVRAGTPASYESGSLGAPAMPDEVVEKTRSGNAAAYAFDVGTRHGRDDRCDFRRRFDPGYLRHHGRPVPGFTSNVFAILGLRSLYFALAGMVSKFRYLKVCTRRPGPYGRGR